jgi:hypothetical protein
MKTSAWDMMQYNLLKANAHLGGTCCFHLQGGRINKARNQRAVCCLLHVFFLGLLFDPED